ncbi:hypothetical protein OO006_11045 [Prosthecochloris sp. SCSIO W1101]|uniref:hypothetical protein n=1 Tax=Prosthecochloris sp. SCSIO W1101 TaxID=2992242 RepID=UPI00223D5DA0|nr:hypothetical protein [Prosthecochloris sp. SCSIO W1101]UZJ40881.1 hypothetical protein OO006_11045 [Prosthecochloris sp. SCSIO W1101]
MSEDKVKIVLPVHINAPVEKVFPLCCPVEEYRWIPGWRCHLIHCPNDKVELGTVFSEVSSAPFLLSSFKGKTTWTAIVHDPVHYKLHFRLDNKKSSSLYKIELQDDGRGGTAGNLDFTCNAINEKAAGYNGKNTAKKILVMLSTISAMLQHYCEAGNMLNFKELQKIVLSESRLSTMDKIRIGLNRMVVLAMYK